ncbi:Phosphatidylinositol 3-kinase VPS34 (PI3-kinase VPS34) (PI3K VPS34) (PtdIns-3-kinase VPS34) (Carboxypeptidase Y-deficient protein 15) (Vacuolar protein sorting-associated protein 34) (Vacuolar protein-targeting protein 29) [Durusdinium trenchii]|uniref:PI3K/PI4K catalytic domain-containing protein n=2 Tax=Durusdinium trenchii TaxID=1381693 RepID=A0ABP0L664_9DINO
MQILLSLRWEPTHLGLGPTRSAQADLLVLDTAKRPLLSFLLRYSIGTEDLEFLSEIYWSLWCLSQDSLDQHRGAYDKARWVLIKALEGKIEYWDSVRGIPLEAPDDLGGPCSFGQRALARLVQQAALWQETRELARLGIQTVGDASEKTRAVQERLQQLATETRDQVRLEDLEDNYFQELVQLDLSAALEAVNLVHPEGFITTPVDPGVRYLGLSAQDCRILKSNAAPLLLESLSLSSSTEPKREKCMVKVGDDLRQDQLVLQLLHFMEMVWEERLPSEESELLRFVPYRVLAMTPDAGYIKFVPGAVSLSKAFASSNGDLAAWLSTHQPRQMTKERVLSNLCGSAAAYCVATYVLGIGDRHLDNLQITPEGHFFHIDFGFIFGEDPKPFAPRLRLPEQIATVLMQEMDESGNLLDKCFRLAARAYIALRRSMSLWVALLRIIGQAGGAGCSGAKQNAAVLVVMDRLRADLDWACEEEKAATEFLLVLTESTEALYPVLTDKVHQLGLFWK